MSFALAERDKVEQIAIRVQTDCSLTASLGFLEGSPREKGEAEIDGGGVKQVESVLKLETMGRNKQAATLNGLEKHRFNEGDRPLFVYRNSFAIL